MKLQEIQDQDFVLQAWTIKNDPRNERRVVLKLGKKTSRGARVYVAHAPFTDKIMSDIEFTEPVRIL